MMWESLLAVDENCGTEIRRQYRIAKGAFQKTKQKINKPENFVRTDI